MAVTDKPNEDYWALKARIDEWGTPATVAVPLLTFSTLGFGGAAVGSVFGSDGLIVGFFIGFVTAQIIWVTYKKRKLGFILHSKEGCQSCRLALAEYRFRRLQLAEICRRCGNDNRIDFHDP